MDSHHLNDNIVFKFDCHSDQRGSLTVASLTDQSVLPFQVNRVFWITGVPEQAQRGMHAHKYCWEALVAVHGTFKVKVDFGNGRIETFAMDTPDKGLLIPPLVWCQLFDFTDDAVCLCLASGDYDKEGYISDYEAFLKEVRK